MNSTSLHLNFARLVQILNIVAWCYLAYFEEAGFSLTVSDRVVRFLPIVPFLVALFFLRHQPSPSEWMLIRIMHQSLAVVIFAYAAIFLVVEFPDTVLVSLWFIVDGVLQLIVWRNARRNVLDLRTRDWPYGAIGVLMVFLFAFGFVALK